MISSAFSTCSRLQQLFLCSHTLLMATARNQRKMAVVLYAIVFDQMPANPTAHVASQEFAFLFRTRTNFNQSINQ